MFRLTFADGGELVLTEGGKKKRAGVWLFTPEALAAELAHLGPDALGLGPERLGEILARERRQLHPLLRDQRALAGIGRAHANEILWLAKLSPFKLSPDLSAAEVERLAVGNRRGSGARARTAAEAGKDDAAVYRDPRALRRALPARPRHAATRRFRGAHDHLLPDLPDGRQGAQGPAPVAAAPLGVRLGRRPARGTSRSKDR